MTDILFYSRDDEYGWLSNFERAPQVLDGKMYPTNEHYYQSQKTADPALSEWIRNAPTPYAAMMAGRTCIRKKDLKENWDILKFNVMYTGLRAKFTDNDKLLVKLLETGDAALHENSPSDMIWGIKGKDMLGKLLMKVREDFKNDPETLKYLGIV